MLLPQTGRTLHVGEEEGERAGGPRHSHNACRRAGEVELFPAGSLAPSLAFGLPARLLADLLKERLGGGSGVGIELLTQEHAQVAIDLQGRRIVPAVGQRLHQRTVRALAQRVYGNHTSPVARSHSSLAR